MVAWQYVEGISGQHLRAGYPRENWELGALRQVTRGEVINLQLKLAVKVAENMLINIMCGYAGHAHTSVRPICSSFHCCGCTERTRGKRERQLRNLKRCSPFKHHRMAQQAMRQVLVLLPPLSIPLPPASSPRCGMLQSAAH